VKSYPIDTNIPSELTKRHPHTPVTDFLVRAGRDRVYLSVPTIGEIAKGIAGLPDGVRREDLREWSDRVLRPWFAGRILPVTENVAERWGVFAAERKRRGRPLATADGLIAATAAVHDLVLVTRNTKDFEDLPVATHNPWH